MAARFAKDGTITRQAFDLATGLPSAGSTVTVPMSLLAREQPETLTDTVQVTSSRVRINKELLVKAGFAVPIEDGDFITFGGLRGAVRTVLERTFFGQDVYICRIEVVNN